MSDAGPHAPAPQPRARGAVLRWLLPLLLVLACAGTFAAAAREWMKIAADDLHDPKSPAIGVLQEPGEALAGLPHDYVGNQVRWMQALESGAIQPRTNILPETKVNLRTTEILLRHTANMPLVKFPHRQHTLWLDCSNCHDSVFQQKAGATQIGMFAVLSGEKCGLCHGAVAFPLTECKRCHSVERDSAEHKSFGTALVREGRTP